MLPKVLIPLDDEHLIRLGNNSDGGYIISKKIFKKCKTCLSFGLGDNFNFEEHLKAINPNVQVYMYDHTINIHYFIKYFFFWLWHNIRYRRLNLRFMYFLRYYNFFLKKKNNFHIREKISADNSLSKIIKTLKINTNNTLLKIDIDGSEYEIIDEIKNYNFLCLVIEFEDADKNIEKIVKFVEENKNLKIIHLHANNFLPVGKNDIPKAIEITFQNASFFKNQKLSNKNYPIPYLDFPNNQMREDIKLKFSNN